MYKILIVDDEKMIREGIKMVIDWEKLSIGTVLLAASGSEALRVIEKEQPDIMLTDISMTEMTGLELIEQAADLKEGLRVLVLTGYDSFEYARRALQLKVQDFLLKPVDEDVLAESIKEQVEYLEKKEKDKQLELEARRAAGVKEQGRLGKCIRDVIHNRFEEQELSFVQERFLNYKEAGFIVAVLALPLYGDKKEEGKVAANLQILSICVDLVDIKEKGISFWDDDGKSIVIVLFAEKCGSEGIDLITEVAGLMNSELGQRPRTAIGSEVKEMRQIKKSYQEAICLLDSEKSQMKDILMMESVVEKKRLFHDVYDEMTNEMCDNISNTSFVMHVFDTFCKAIHSYNLSEGYARKCCFDIASNLYYANLNAGCTKPEQTLDTLAESMRVANVEACCDLTRQYLDKMLNHEEESHDIVSRAKHYINQRLGEELSVSLIAENQFVSPNYFSRLFKRVTGEGCNEYIVRKRMEQACRLLETTNFNTGKIAVMVGYHDCNYFSITFKKHVGVSPTNYRSSHI